VEWFSAALCTLPLDLTLGSEFVGVFILFFKINFFLKFMRVDEELYVFMCQEITVPCLIFCYILLL
jgi:hypothetical protein